ncbi:MAG: DNA-3-methyladenine glycosylase 2 family protein [Oscillospiraceae bacterium]|nr:DNA-3-methyladenine glycosylase 2 family protein [Oscillospiraceae bacterium]
MLYYDRGDEIEIMACDDFDLVKTFECGQCFRWDADENGYYWGVAKGKALRLRSSGDSIFLAASMEEFESIWYDYFDLDSDYSLIRNDLAIDDFIGTAIEFGKGIRILRQDGWEALCSFILSSQNNIPRIKKIIATLCQEFGNNIDYLGKNNYSFPAASTLAKLNEDDLAPIRSGFRAKYVIAAAKAVDSGEIDLDKLMTQSIDDARRELIKIKGVGEKIAQCVMLYGLHMKNAFPVDVWMKRAISQNYGDDFDYTAFGLYAGIAQQYIYFYTRSLELR